MEARIGRDDRRSAPLPEQGGGLLRLSQGVGDDDRAADLGGAGKGGLVRLVERLHFGLGRRDALHPQVFEGDFGREIVPQRV